MTVDEIRNIIRNPEATAADLRRADAAADALIKSFGREVDELEVRRQDLLLEPDGAAKLKKVDEQIRAHDLQSEICIAAKARLVGLIAEADARELEADIQRHAREGAEIVEQMKQIYADLDAVMVETVVPSLDRLMHLEGRLRASMNFVANNGRSDLKPVWPLVQLGQYLNWPADKFPQVNTWSLHGYWPAHSRTRHQFGDMKAILGGVYDAASSPAADASPKSATLLQRAGHLLATSMPSLGGAGAKAAPTSVTQKASA